MKINLKNDAFKYIYMLSALCIGASLLLALKTHLVKSDIFFFAALFLSVIGTSLYLFNKLIKTSKQTVVQMTVVWGVFALFWNVAMVTLVYSSTQLNYPLMLFGAVAINFNFSAYFIALFLSQGEVLYLNFKRHIPYLVLCLLFIIANINTLDLWFKSDSNVYYTFITEGAYKWNFSLNSISSLSIAGHSMYGYSIFAYVGEYLFPEAGLGIRLVNIILSCVTIICFYKIIQNLWNSLTTIQLFLITGCFGGGAWFLGLSQEISSDFPLMCFFIWFIYSYIKNYTILKIATSIIICFSKEYGIMLVGMFVLGVAIYRFITIKAKNFFWRILVSIYMKDWFLLIAPVLFGINLLFNKEGWSTEIAQMIKEPGTDRSIYLNSDYIFLKFKEMFLMNFQWIILVLVFLFLIMCIVRKAKFNFKLSPIMTGIVLSYISFLIFNFVYFTFAHYRYIQLNMFFTSLIIAHIISNIKIKSYKKNIILGFIFCTFVLQSYFTIDPITLKLFRNINTGKGKIVTTTSFMPLPGHGTKLFGENDGAILDNHIFRDFVQYNRSYTGFEHVFEISLNQIEYDSNKAICIPPIYESLDYTLENLIGRATAEKKYYWSIGKKQLTTDLRDFKINWIDANQLNYNDFKTYSDIWFIKFPYDDRYDYDKFFSKVNVEETVTVDYGIWKLDLYRVTKK